MATEFVTVTKAHQIAEGTLAVFDVRGNPIAVANVAGTYFAFHDTCTHKQCSLAEGDLAGTTVTCMCHGAKFDVRTGRVLAPPAQLPITVYRTRIDGDALQIEV